ncbi:MAG: hypothetical protein RQ826_05100 [Xanthomonadales bacterium]|nr:hypothetical protein [Xanthomonadales bacterium]
MNVAQMLAEMHRSFPCCKNQSEHAFFFRALTGRFSYAPQSGIAQKTTQLPNPC